MINILSPLVISPPFQYEAGTSVVIVTAEVCISMRNCNTLTVGLVNSNELEVSMVLPEC